MFLTITKKEHFPENFWRKTICRMSICFSTLNFCNFFSIQDWWQRFKFSVIITQILQTSQQNNPTLIWSFYHRLACDGAKNIHRFTQYNLIHATGVVSLQIVFLTLKCKSLNLVVGQLFSWKFKGNPWIYLHYSQAFFVLIQSHTPVGLKSHSLKRTADCMFSLSLSRCLTRLSLLVLAGFGVARGSVESNPK